MDKGCTTKSLNWEISNKPNMRVEFQESSQRCLKLKGSGWKSIYLVGCNKNSFSPEIFWYIISDHESLGHFQVMTVFPFSNSILLRGMDTRTLVKNSLFNQLLTQNFIEVFTTIINSKDLDLSLELVFNQVVEVVELFEDICSFRLSFSKKTQQSRV